MSSPLRRAFVRRPQREGAQESICPTCYAAVGTSVCSAELEGAEKNHICDPELLEWWRRMAESRSCDEGQA